MRRSSSRRARPGRQPAGAQRLGDRRDLLVADRRRLEAEHGRRVVSDESFDIGLESNCRFSAVGALERLLAAVADGEDRARAVGAAAELAEARGPARR